MAERRQRMKQIRKGMISLLIAIMVIGGMTFYMNQNLTNAKEEDGWFRYEILDDDTIKITRCCVIYEEGYLYTEDLVIPSQIEGRKVVCIGSYAFTDLPKNILNIVIHNGITTIESHAFEGNNNIGCVSLPDTVSYIGEKAFYNCKELSHINIPSNTIIGKDAFAGCDKLEIDYETEPPTEVTTTSGTGEETTKFSENNTTAPATKETTKANVSIGKTKVKKVSKKFISKKIMIKLKRISGSKYQVKISTTSKFKKQKTFTRNVTKSTFIIKNKRIQKKKVLYVKARAYKVLDGKTYFGKWSNVKKVIIKK